MSAQGGGQLSPVATGMLLWSVKSRDEVSVDLPGDVALEASDDFARAHSLGSSALSVVLSGLVMAEST